MHQYPALTTSRRNPGFLKSLALPIVQWNTLAASPLLVRQGFIQATAVAQVFHWEVIRLAAHKRLAPYQRVLQSIASKLPPCKYDRRPSHPKCR